VGVDVPDEAAKQIVASLSLKSVSDLKDLVGEHGKEAVEELTTLFEVATAYGYGDWLYFDASVVRGLAYYTGIVFEGFDRRGELRAICGGGRYDKLLSLYGSETVVPACGFGFGDCVIMELLREKGQVPTLEPLIDFVVMAFNAEMRPGQVSLAATLREAHSVVLDDKRRRWRVVVEYGGYYRVGPKVDPFTTKQVGDMLERRSAHQAKKEYEEADRLHAELTEMGIVLDTRLKTWKRPAPKATRR